MGVSFATLHTVLKHIIHSSRHVSESLFHVPLHVSKALLHLSHSLAHVAEGFLHLSLLVGKVGPESRVLVLLNSGSLALWCIGILSHLLALSILADHGLAFAVLANLLLASLRRLLMLLSISSHGGGVRR